MARSTYVSASIIPADKTTVLTAINDIKAKLPFLVNLTGDQKKHLHKMGEKGVPYVLDTLRGVQTFPDVFPASFDKAEFEKDGVLVQDLRDIQIAMNAVAEGIDDTLMAAGCDAMSAADEAYGYLKAAAKSNTSIKQLVDEIGRRYDRASRTAPTTPPTP